MKRDTEFADLFRLATLLWSVPVSRGFGRRLRFVVTDKSNGKLVGLFALGDPVFNLRARDRWIGWDHKMRADRLYNVMDIFVLGAVPPYSSLLGGKLVAMLATSSEVRRTVWKKYAGSTTVIRQEEKKPSLALLTTTSALGRSSLYNRIKFAGEPLYTRIGETLGWGHFHLANGTFRLMRDFLDTLDHPITAQNRFGHGPNWKIRTVRTCLELLDLPPDLLQHGISREVYAAPIAINCQEFLRGESNRPRYYHRRAADLHSYFMERWFLPRAKRCPDYVNTKACNTLAELRRLARKRKA